MEKKTARDYVCGTRRKYKTLASAEQTSERMEKELEIPSDIYKCKFCGNYHIITSSNTDEEDDDGEE